jgi:hypothetical protein
VPGQARHLAAARRNEQFSRHLLGIPDYLEWAAISAFYSALHFVDAYLARRGLHPGDHGVRDSYLRRTELRNVYFAYRTLRTASEDYRYALRQAALDDVVALLDTHQAAIRRRVEDLL